MRCLLFTKITSISVRDLSVTLVGSFMSCEKSSVRKKFSSLIASYLADHSQRVAVNGDVSTFFPLKKGVPQGSCLGPILFTVCTNEPFDIVEKHLPSVHCYANDSQLYVAISPNVPGDD